MIVYLWRRRRCAIILQQEPGQQTRATLSLSDLDMASVSDLSLLLHSSASCIEATCDQRPWRQGEMHEPWSPDVLSCLRLLYSFLVALVLVLTLESTSILGLLIFSIVISSLSFLWPHVRVHCCCCYCSLMPIHSLNEWIPVASSS